MGSWRVVVIVALALWLGVSNGWAYSEVKVTNGGTIRGKVTLTGEKPRPMAFNLVTIPDPVYCGRISTGTGWRIVEDFIIAPDGSLKDVVVMLKHVKRGKAFTMPEVRVEAVDCDFLPFINVLRDQDQIAVVNMDPVEHDIQGYETSRTRGARVLFNRPLPMNALHQMINVLGGESHTHLPGTPMVEQVHLRKGRNIFVMQCGFHPYMFSWGVLVDNPYFAITTEDGTFEIKDIPPGTYTLVAWHAGMKATLEQEVVVPANGVISADFSYAAPKGRRSVHEMVDNPKFGLELLGEGVEIVPSVRLQKP